jgi:hypothetical protein
MEKLTMRLEYESVTMAHEAAAELAVQHQTVNGCFRDVIVVLDKPRLGLYREDLEYLKELQIGLGEDLPISMLLANGARNA